MEKRDEKLYEAGLVLGRKAAHEKFWKLARKDADEYGSSRGLAALPENLGDAEAVGRVIIKNIWRIDTATLQDMCGIVEAAGAEDQQVAIRQLHTKLLAELQAREVEAE